MLLTTVCTAPLSLCAHGLKMISSYLVTLFEKSSPFTSKQIQRPCQKSKLSCKGSKIHSISCLTAFIRLTEHSYICKANTRGFVINICISTYAHPSTYRCKCLDVLRQQTKSAVQSSGNGLFTSPGQFIR